MKKSGRSSQSVTQGSTITSDAGAAATDPATKTNTAVWSGRIAFIFILALVAMTFGYLSYYLLTESENELIESQFESIANRAACSALDNTVRKRLGTVSLASVIAGANSDASQWPFVSLNNFENIASNLIDTSKGCRMAFAPLVQPEELQNFETHVYDYYETTRKPEPFPNSTAVSSFGKGVWAIDPILETPDQRYHDTEGNTVWGSTSKVLAPMLQHSSGAFPKLMMNFHSNPMLGKLIDDMLECADKQAMNGGSLDDCIAISSILPKLSSWTQGAESGPGAMMMSPVYPSNEPTKVRRWLLALDRYPSAVF